MLRQLLFKTWRLRDHALHRWPVRHRVLIVMLVAKRLRDGAPTTGRPLVAVSLGPKAKRRNRRRRAVIVATNALALPPLPTELWHAILELLPGDPLKHAFMVTTSQSHPSH